MYTDRDIYIARCRRQDLMAEAERERLCNLAVGTRGSLVQVYRRMMARFGAWLVARGNWLQERYTASTIQTLAAQGE
jgi:hypothetical protein